MIVSTCLHFLSGLGLVQHVAEAASEGDSDLVPFHIRCVIVELDEKSAFGRKLELTLPPHKITSPSVVSPGLYTS